MKYIPKYQKGRTIERFLRPIDMEQDKINVVKGINPINTEFARLEALKKKQERDRMASPESPQQVIGEARNIDVQNKINEQQIRLNNNQSFSNQFSDFGTR